MQEVINLNLVAMEEGSSINPKSVMDFLKASALNDRLEFDSERMLVRVGIFDSRASQIAWEAAGRRFPLVMYFDPESEGGKAVMKLFEGLSSGDRAELDMIPAKVGCRMSLYIRRERTDLVARFWEAMFPPGIAKDAARALRGRVREVDCISVKVPDDMVFKALKKGKASDRIINPDGSVYVTEEIFRQLREEQEKDFLRMYGKSKGKNHTSRGGR